VDLPLPNPTPYAGAALRTLTAVGLTVFPHGGQRTARRNAHAAMLATAEISRLRAQADAELRAAILAAAGFPAGGHVATRHAGVSVAGG